MHHRLPHISLCALLFALALSGPAKAQKPSPAPELGYLSDQYATLSGGWYLNDRCDLLNADDKTALSWHVERITVAMGKIADLNFLMGLQKAAKTAAESAPYAACGANVREIVEYMLVLAKIMSQALTGEVYAPGKPLLETQATRYEVAYTAIQIEKQCARLPPDLNADFVRVFNAVRMRLQQSEGVAAIARIEAAADQNLQARSHTMDPCGPQTAAFVVTALGVIRKMEQEK